MPVVHQPSMWDVAESAVLTPLGGRVVRHHLDRGAWVDHLPGWVAGSDEVLEVLLGDIGWRADRRQMYEREVDVPRLLRWYGGGESCRTPCSTRRALRWTGTTRSELGEPFVSAGLCLYRDGRDSVAWHGDRIGRGRTQTRWSRSSPSAHPDALVAAAGGRWWSRCVPLGHGDLVVMGGSCQRTWEHASPRRPRPVGPRVSVQFRPRGVA